MDRRSIRYVGRVQGVGFRATARSVAVQHGVSGWVRNEADGSVLLEAQGPPHALEAFLEALKNRMGSFIHSQHAAPMTPVEGETGFEVRR